MRNGRARYRSIGRFSIVAMVLSCAVAVKLPTARAAAPAKVDAEPTTVQNAVEKLGLADDQKRAVDSIVGTYRQKMEQAQKQMLAQMRLVLLSAQYEQIVAAINGQPVTAQVPGAAVMPAASKPTVLNPDQLSQAAVTFTGGLETDPRDRGRPVVLIAAALKVSSDVFRQAFSGVTPAGPGQQPEPAQVRKNKEALLAVLGPYGITNDRLDEVSNYYRYSRSRGQMWRHTPAVASATIQNGVVTGFTIVDAGSGYSSSPEVSIAGMPDVKAEARLEFGTDFKKNGSIAAIAVIPAGAQKAGE